MKIAFRGGHNEQATGATAIIDELTEDRRVLAECIKVAKEQGHEVLDCTPGPCDVNTDLAYGVNKANAWGADMYVPIHFDKAYNTYNGALGTGAFVYSKNDNYKDEDIAARIVNNLAGLGFKNRGVKEADYYDLRMTKMAAVLVEVCFCEATEDVALYRSLGPRKIAEAIVGGIINKKIIERTSIIDFKYYGELLVGNTIKMHVITNNSSENKFAIRNPKGEWLTVREYKDSSIHDYTFEEEGQYRLVVHSRTQCSNSEYDDYKYIDVNVVKVKAKNIDVTINYQEGNIKFGVESEEDLIYKLIVCDRSTGQWKTLQEYSDKSSTEYSPNNNGLHRLVVHVKHKNSINDYDDYSFVDINIEL